MLLTSGFGPEVKSSQMNLTRRLQLKTFHVAFAVRATQPDLLIVGGCPGAHARKKKQRKGSRADVENSSRLVSFKPTNAKLSSLKDELADCTRNVESFKVLVSDAMCAKFPPRLEHALYAVE